jgi:hypothetical protein
MKLKSTLLAATILFSGCYWNTPVIDLISPPRLTGEQTEIFNALISSRGSALTLKYPKTGDFLSAFVFRPDADNQVMVFYQLTGTSAGTTAEPTVNLTFLEKRSNRWVITHTFPFIATDIERVDFSLLGDSDRQNIIISYSINQPDKNLRVFSFDENNIPESVYHRDFCVFYEVGDFYNSGEYRLLSINQSRSELITEAIADFAGWQDGEFVTMHSVDANPNAVKYEKSIKGVLENGQSTLFLEYLQANGSHNTGIIVFNDRGRPRNVVYSHIESRREEHLKLLEKRPNQHFTAHAYARDIDGDGIVKSAGNRLFPGYDHENITSGEWIWAAIWYTIDPNDRLQKQHYTFLSVNNDYVFFFPQEWEETVTVTVNNEIGEVIFWKYDSTKYENIFDVTNKLFSITSDYNIEVFCDSLETENLQELMRKF